MPRSRKVKKPEEVYTLLSIRVDTYEARADVTINYNVIHPQYAIDLHDSDPLFRHVTQLVIAGTLSDPADRPGDRYEITLRGDDSPGTSVNATLQDAQVRGEYGSPQYRQYRGREIPVYKPPSGLGLINKERGQPFWRGWVTIAPRLVTDMLVLLGHKRSLYLAIQERKAQRSRWIHSISLQTTDPAEE